MREPLSGPIKAITGNGTLTTQYIVHFSATFQICAALRRGRHVTYFEMLPSCFIITDEAILSRAIQMAPMTKPAIARRSQSQRQRSCLFWRRHSGSLERTLQWLSQSDTYSPLCLRARGFRVAPKLLSLPLSRQDESPPARVSETKSWCVLYMRRKEKWEEQGDTVQR